MLRLAAVDAFDVLVLISGDTDHAPAVEGVRLLGKQVYVASWGGLGLSPRLRRAAFDHINLVDGLAEFAVKIEASPANTPLPNPLDSSASHALKAVVSESPIASASPHVSENSAEKPLATTTTVAGAGVLHDKSLTAATVPPDARDAFLDELRRAEAKFTTGYVGKSYFLSRWQSSRLDASTVIRGRVLDRLVRDGLVEIYNATDGAQALRCVRSAP
jgi:hypothetical protein